MSTGNKQNYKFETLQLHAGQSVNTDNGSRTVPIYQTSSYVFPDTDTAAKMFALEKDGFTYSRHKNPTNAVFEERMAALEGGISAVACASGMAAQFLVLTSLANSGDEIVASSFLYGGTTIQLKYSLARLGITTHFVKEEDPNAFKEAITEKTRAIFIESIGNPKMSVIDIEAIADIAHEHNIPLIVDNTFGAGGYVCNPISFGADVVTHSATKWIGGHGTSLGGVFIDSGNFNWANGKFVNLSKPAPMCHNLVFTDKYGKNALTAFARAEVLKHMGPSLSPFNSFLLLQGLETLSLRMERHCSNALALAQYLENHSQVSWVWYPGLKNSPYYKNAQKFLRDNMFGSMIAFGLKDGIEAGKKAIESFKLVSHLANVGDSKTLAIHAASSTHQQLNEQEMKEGGVLPEMVRISVGTEHIDDILADFEQALTS